MSGMKLFTKTLAILLAVFALVANGASLLFGIELYNSLEAEYRSKGRAIARSIADSGVDLLLSSDVETLQSTVDKFQEIAGVSYVLVQSEDGAPVAHTFVPEVPREILELKQGAKRSRVDELELEGIGSTLNVMVPILGGLAGHVHVGMDASRIESRIWAGVIRMQVLVLVLLVVTIIVAVAVVRRISRPLGDLTEHAQALAEAGLDGEGVPPIAEGTLESNDESGGSPAPSCTWRRSCASRPGA